MSGFVAINAPVESTPPSPRSEYSGNSDNVVNSVEQTLPVRLSGPNNHDANTHPLSPPREASPTELTPVSKTPSIAEGTAGPTPEPSEHEDTSMEGSADGNTTVDDSLGDTTVNTSMEDNSLVIPSEDTLDATDEDESFTNDQPATAMTKAQARAARDFECVFNPKGQCNTGQYTMDLARKTISHHFGRNKACTRAIKGWPMYCRKHYQRGCYGKHQWQMTKIDLIKHMFKKIESQYPGIEYTIAMKKSEEKRINEYAREQAFPTTKEYRWADTPSCIPAKGESQEAPMSLLIKLQDRMGPDRDMKFCRETINIIKKEIEADTTDKLELPSIEFLPQIPGLHTPKKSRVSTKGRVQKPK
ncbi:uncharacterized protein BDZ99DRAFT_272353 [Mytilinidion resinicola]|uniref:Uncharacterized protein n=1 Tax=Mytilinidion resinicola TaxID=574789 RepID=A0A6A6YWD6_9PEZI|nr:uncharacterized protein BDZ99DRAFT_272353 [Mytilinidion resinicola]KAF2812703.1 hypothetical protein BDZ99DRAFT_272353 [Mytilinidion resinicola]